MHKNKLFKYKNNVSSDVKVVVLNTDSRPVVLQVDGNPDSIHHRNFFTSSNNFTQPHGAIRPSRRTRKILKKLNIKFQD